MILMAGAHIPGRLAAQEIASKFDSLTGMSERLLQKDVERGQRFTDSVLAVATEQGWEAGMLHFRYMKSKYVFRKSDPEAAKAQCREVLEEIGAVEATLSPEDQKLLMRLRFLCNYHLSVINYSQGDYTLAFDYSEKADSLLQRNFEGKEEFAYFYQRNSINVRTLKGQIYYVEGELGKAAEVFEETARLYLDLEDMNNAAVSFMNIGVIYQNAGKLAESMRALQRAKEIAEENGFDRLSAQINASLGQLYYSMRKYPEALQYSGAAFGAYQSMDNKYGIALSAVDVGDNFKKLDRTDSALWYYELSLRLHTEMQNKDDMAYVLDRFASLLGKEGACEDALAYSEQGLAIARENELMEESLWLNLTKADCLLKLGRLSESMVITRQLLDMAEETDNINQLRDVYGLAHRVYSTAGQHKAAYDYFERYSQYQDSIYDEDKSMDIAAARFEYELERETSRLRAEQDRQELIYQQELERERWTRYAALGFSFLLAIVAILAWRAYKIKQEANRLLADKNERLEELREREKRLSAEALATKERELATMAMTNHEKNTLLQELERKVKLIESTSPDEVQPGLREMKRTIADSYSLDRSWDSFLHKFNDVHPRFFDQLKEEFPSLTINDLKLSAYLRIGMSNKDIANATNLAPGSVKSKINRLKKKMNMGADDNVRDWVLARN